MTTNNNNTIVWGCIGRSCALCKKDHKACNGARPCTRCIAMGWESECRDVALKPRGRPRKTRTTTPTATTSSTHTHGAKSHNKGNKRKENESDSEQELSISPSLFVSSFPFRPVKDSPPVVSMDISEKFNRLTQRLVTQLPPSGLRSDVASPKVNRKRRASGPSAVEASKRREMNSRLMDDRSDDSSDDESECDEDELNAAMEEDLTPFETVFKVNLVSSCSSSSKKSDRQRKNRANTVKTTTSSTATLVAKKEKESDDNNNNNAECYNNDNNNCLRRSAERQALQRLEEEIEMFSLELPPLDQQQAQQQDGLLAMNTDALLLGNAEPDIPLATNISCAEQYVQQYWSQKQQQTQQPQQPQQQVLVGENILDAFMLDLSSSTSSFMFLKTEPMALAQEERLGRNPYFIRTPPQMRRNAHNAKAVFVDDCMQEDEESW